MAAQNSQDTLMAGTGFMVSLSAAQAHFERRGYQTNLVARFDHFECNSGEKSIYPGDFEVDSIFRFENSSDPDDQAILYAISFDQARRRGIFIEAYGIYQESLSPAMLQSLCCVGGAKNRRAHAA